MPVPVGMSPGRREPGSPYYEDQEPDREPDPDAEYERQLEKEAEKMELWRKEAEAVCGGSDE